jgi:hypothetical protein
MGSRSSNDDARFTSLSRHARNSCMSRVPGGWLGVAGPAYCEVRCRASVRRPPRFRGAALDNAAHRRNGRDPPGGDKHLQVLAGAGLAQGQRSEPSARHGRARACDIPPVPVRGPAPQARSASGACRTMRNVVPMCGWANSNRGVGTTSEVPPEAIWPTAGDTAKIHAAAAHLSGGRITRARRATARADHLGEHPCHSGGADIPLKREGSREKAPAQP